MAKQTEKDDANGVPDFSNAAPAHAAIPLKLEMSPDCGLSRKTGRAWYRLDFVVSRGDDRSVYGVMLKESEILGLKYLGIKFPPLAEKELPERAVYGSSLQG